MPCVKQSNSLETLVKEARKVSYWSTYISSTKAKVWGARSTFFCSTIYFTLFYCWARRKEVCLPSDLQHKSRSNFRSWSIRRHISEMENKEPNHYSEKWQCNDTIQKNTLSIYYNLLLIHTMSKSSESTEQPDMVKV